ncbi:hypothetical protein E3N88_19925 [Mikania micrantha]|uniref:Reverse transcriptase zinc-binding domain-containing protein n=1 Tax=Mikania micrantha TaxID=192012 RepID=A0A5N6NQX4_9ASTR|nr:hypothetical protein E3N88_19925 [Mikania micrantha]
MDFSVRVARELIEARLLPLDNYHISWSRWVPLKVNAFAWRAGLDHIPSEEGVYVVQSTKGINPNNQGSAKHARLMALLYSAQKITSYHLYRIPLVYLEGKECEIFRQQVFGSCGNHG